TDKVVVDRNAARASRYARYRCRAHRRRNSSRHDEPGIGLRNGKPRAGIGRPAIEAALAVVAVREQREPGSDILRGSHRHRIVFLLGDEVLPRQLVTAVGAAGGRGAGIRRGESASRYRIRGRADHQRARTAARSAVVTTTRVALVATEEAAIVARQVVAIDMLVG